MKKPSSTNNLGINQNGNQPPLLSPSKLPHQISSLQENLIEIDPVDSYIKADKVPVRLVKNCGLLVEDEPFGDLLENQSKYSRKKDSIFHQAHKIPIEISSARSHQSKKGWRKYAGIIFAVLSSLCFSLTMLLAKVLRDDHAFHPICITVWRYLGILVPALPLCVYCQWCTKENIFGSVWPLSSKNLKHCCGYIVQGICGCTSIIFRFYSLEFLTVADSSVISYSSPVFVTILAHFCLQEKCGVVTIFVSLLTAVGVVVIARPPMLTGSASYDSNLWVGAVLAVASMACASGLIILLRNIRQTHFSLLLLVSGGWGVSQSAVLSFSLEIFKSPENLHETMLIGLLCLLTFFGQIGIVLALKYEHAGPVSVVRSSEVLFAFVWQLQFLGVYPDVFSAIGAGIIILAVLAIATRTWVVGLPPDNIYRSRLSCLTK